MFREGRSPSNDPSYYNMVSGCFLVEVYEIPSIKQPVKSVLVRINKQTKAISDAQIITRNTVSFFGVQVGAAGWGLQRIYFRKHVIILFLAMTSLSTVPRLQSISNVVRVSTPQAPSTYLVKYAIQNLNTDTIRAQKIPDTVLHGSSCPIKHQSNYVIYTR